MSIEVKVIKRWRCSCGRSGDLELNDTVPTCCLNQPLAWKNNISPVGCRDCEKSTSGRCQVHFWPSMLKRIV